MTRLRAIAQAYATCARYRDSGMVLPIVDGRARRRILFKTEFTRHESFSFSFGREGAHPWQSVTSMGEELERIVGTTSGAAHQIPKLLRPEIEGRSILAADDLREGLTVEMEGRRCRVFSLSQVDAGAQIALWVREDLAIVRVELRVGRVETHFDYSIELFEPPRHH